MRFSAFSRSLCLVLAAFTTSLVSAEDTAVKVANLPVEVSPQQKDWYKKYKTQPNITKPSQMLLNTDPEPDLDEGFTPLFNGTDLSGWTPKGGTCKFEVKDETIVGTCVQGSESTYLSTDRDDFEDFLFTCEIKWEVEGNTGVMFRAKTKEQGDRTIVYGPQAEMEGFSGDRGWSGGVYGQSCGGYFYPLWLKAHEKVRSAIDKDGWNRITVLAKGDVVKTWVNGIPASHWVGDGTYDKGFFGLQIHKGKKGKVHFREIKVKELDE
ncbi:hypothetical protein LF1_19300 [Rubripirellula obstinata]|uniref:3-keto-alpha-glucoside-1,2-lyase/3-keto-2-hydroxy-glucal hydratase domain-containing protein n=1 Tax=Rubripirellula obstinata TaxID=406547 RepID=A0A5B1CE31_9BACT|nr:DUF1080 domain-containing protein [Rubripirellula obstinata]KAA1259398.1 hypothetical protein LF1_19300 [Rubripirellula obstinata]